MQQPIRRPQQTSLKELDVGYYVRHYLDLLWRWKWYIVSVGPPVALVATIAVFAFLPLKPELPVTVLIGMDNPAAYSPVEEFYEMNSSKVELLSSRSFLRLVVDKLSLRLRVKDEERSEVFDSCYADTTAAMGKYRLWINTDDGDEKFRIFYTNEKLGIKDKAIQSGPLAALKEVKLPGMYIRFSQEFLKEPGNLEFFVSSTRRTVDYVLGMMEVEGPDPRRGRDHISITLEGHDYTLITTIVNTIANIYVEQNLSIRKRRTKEALRVLKKQLARASEQLAVSEGKVREYLSTNPRVGLDMGAQQTVAELMELEANNAAGNMDLREAQRLQSYYTGSTGDGRLQAVNEILLFLSTRNNTQATVLRSKLSQLQAEREELTQNYARTHPVLQEKRQQIAGIGEQAFQALNKYISDVQSEIQRKRQNARHLSGRLQSLPGKERQLAELQSKQSIDSELYSEILTRYNEAKVADAAEVADVFVMDYAVPPIPPGKLLMVLKFIGIGLGVGCAVAFGPAILVDMVDKTARTEFELKKMTDMTVLECIPVIEPEKHPHQKA
ncbi:MAG: hypothetical protein GF401_04830 [Chitinivibrionales bacterium]|nr:hypothetical protein [Chitinivibrionales bacterium]